MTDHDDLIRIQRYTRGQAAELLNIPDTWLKVWVSGGAVPHQRSGQPGPRQRGVWFTYDNILRIGHMLPTLMSGRQANSRAEKSGGSEVSSDHCAAEDLISAASRPTGVSDEEFEAFSTLASLRRR